MNLDRFAYDDGDGGDSYEDSSNHDHIKKVQFLYSQPVVVSPDESGRQTNRLPSLTNKALKADDGGVKFKKNGVNSSSSSSSSSSVDRRKLYDNNDDNGFGKKNTLIDPYNQGNDYSSNSSHRSYNNTGLDVSVDSSNTIVDKGSRSNNKSYDNKVAAVLPTDTGYYGIATLLTDIQKKKERIRRFIHRCSRDGETINVKQMLENYYHNKQLSFEQAQSNQYHVLLQLVEEACYICRAIYYICLNATPDDTTTTNNNNNNNNNNNISHRSIISRFLNTGLVKLLIVMLTKVYLFQCAFDNPSLPMEYRRLHMPEQLLIAIRYLIKCGEYMSMSMTMMMMMMMMMMMIMIMIHDYRMMTITMMGMMMMM